MQNNLKKCWSKGNEEEQFEQEEEIIEELTSETEKVDTNRNVGTGIPEETEEVNREEVWDMPDTDSEEDDVYDGD